MELPTLFSPLLEFQRFELRMVRRREGGRRGERKGRGVGWGGRENTDVRPSTGDQCTLFTTRLFAYYRANAQHEHQQLGYSYYRQEIT